MTLILNILHKNMSILAADKKAIAEWSVSEGGFTTVPNSRGPIVDDFNKITVNLSKTLALGIAGLTKDHGYIHAIEQSEFIDEGLRTIREHIESFVPIYDRVNLNKLTQFMANEGIASFFDQSTGKYFSSKYLFSPVEIQARLHRATDEIKVFYAGSGSKYFRGPEGLGSIDSFTASIKDSCTPELCISWLQDVYKSASYEDPESGADAICFISTRSQPEFRSWPNGG
jgi:hypothetical protein